MSDTCKATRCDVRVRPPTLRHVRGSCAARVGSDSVSMCDLSQERERCVRPPDPRPSSADRTRVSFVEDMSHWRSHSHGEWQSDCTRSGMWSLGPAVLQCRACSYAAPPTKAHGSSLRDAHTRTFLRSPPLLVQIEPAFKGTTIH